MKSSIQSEEAFLVEINEKREVVRGVEELVSILQSNWTECRLTGSKCTIRVFGTYGSLKLKYLQFLVRPYVSPRFMKWLKANYQEWHAEIE